MNLIQNLKLAFSKKAREQFKQDLSVKVLAEYQAYEAAERWSNRRSTLYGKVQDVRWDITKASRDEIIRKSRSFDRNGAFFNRILDLKEQYTVGANGLQIIPSSSSPEYNMAAKDEWSRWQEVCNLDSTEHFGVTQTTSARTEGVDGELYIYKTNGRTRADGQSYPRIQLFETHRIGTPPERHGDKNIQDGHVLNGNGRTIGYWIQVSDGYKQKWELIDAANVVHIFEPSRVGMIHGMPLSTPVLPDMIDLDDLQRLEMDACKEAASVTSVIKNKAGEITDVDAARRQRLLIDGVQGTAAGSDQVRDAYYQDVFQGKAKVLKTGDDFVQHKSERPSVATQGYWDFLTSKICLGCGTSPILVMPRSIQGTVMRADLDIQGTYYRSRSFALGAKFTEIYRYVIYQAGRNVAALAKRPPDWNRVTIRAPRSVNVDVGRNSNAIINEYEAGFLSLDAICGERGEDWREVLEQRARERARAAELEKQYDLAPGSLIDASLEAIKQVSESNTGIKMEAEPS